MSATAGTPGGPADERRYGLRHGLLGPLLGLVLATALLSVAEPASSTPTITGSEAPVQHVGRWLTNARGEALIFHGPNLVNKRPPFTPAAIGFGATAARTLAANGFNVVRLGVLFGTVEPEPGVIDERYLDSIAATVDVLARHGITSLLDFHQDQLDEAFGGEGFPSWAVDTRGLPVRRFSFPLGYTQSPGLSAAYDSLWDDRPGPGGVGLQERYAGAWEAVARRFADDPWVLGYDLFNEPWPAQASEAQLGAFYEKLVRAIRRVDRRHLVWYEPWVLSDFGTPIGLPRLTGAGLGMSFHDYCPTTTESHEAQCAATETQPITNALARSATTSDALFLSEFGATTDLEDLGRVVDLADGHQLSWTEWAYCGCGDPTGSVPVDNEALVLNPARAGQGTNVEQPKLAVLAEPYPTAVAGTPLSYGFDRPDHRFTLTYSTRSPDGQTFLSGTPTAVVLPPVQYPSGYRVAVAGGTVRSAPSAGLLCVVAGPTSRSVTVTVTPASHGRTDDPTGAPCMAR